MISSLDSILSQTTSTGREVKSSPKPKAHGKEITKSESCSQLSQSLTSVMTGLDAQPEAGLAESIKELVHLAQEQGYLTHNDIKETLPSHLLSPDDLEKIFSKLTHLEIEIVDRAEVEHAKEPEEGEKS